MESDGLPTTRSSRNLFDSLQPGVDDSGDRPRPSVIDREEDDDTNDSSEGEMSDEDEFAPFSDQSNDDDSSDDSTRSSEDESQALDSSITEEVVDGTVVRTRSYYGTDGTEWSSTPVAPNAQTPQANVVTLPRNRIPNTQNATTPAEVFSLFVSQNIIKVIVKYTNEEGRRQKGDAWIETDDVEIRGLIGILVFLGAQKQSKVNLVTIWQPLIGQDFVRATMSRHRCFQLLNALRFDNKDSRRRRQETDKLAALREVLDLHQANLKDHFVPGCTLTVDEQLIPFRGRCSFIQYIPSKPAKYGLKCFWICDSVTYYPLKFIVYTGAMSRIPRITGQGQGHAVVLELSLPYQNKGRNITMDNFFTDTALAERLIQKRTTLIGTVRRNKRFLPKEFKAKKHLKQHDSLFAFSDEKSILSYQGHKNKNVILLSTMHSQPEIVPGERRKPQIVIDYNSTKGGVDTMDQMCLNFTTKRQTKRWPMILFYNMLDTSTVAAGVVFKAKFPNDPLSSINRRAEFMRSVAKDLMRFQMLRRFQTLIRASRPLRTVMRDCLTNMGLSVEEGPVAAAAATTAESNKRGRCGLCSWKANKKGSVKCNKCRNFLCKDHIGKTVLLCKNCIEQ